MSHCWRARSEQKFPLADAGTLLIHVKDRNSIKRSTPLGRVQIPLLELYRSSINTATGEVKTVEKRYSLTPEPWMDKRAANLGELCLKTEVRGSAAVVNELIQRLGSNSPSKLQGSLSFASFHDDDADDNESSMGTTEAGARPSGADVADTVVSEETGGGGEIRTMTVTDNTGASKWKSDVFSLSLLYPDMFKNTNTADHERYKLHLRVHGARHLLGQAAAQILSDAFGGKHSDADSNTPWTADSRRSRDPSVNAYFTIIPVRSDGGPVHSEKEQSLTVYNTRNPSWPEHEFVFGTGTEVSKVSYLSLHIYSRDLLEESFNPVSRLLKEEERKESAWLKRYFLHKLSPSGEVDDDGLETLQFDQRVLAYRRCLGSGRFYPARVQRYLSLPDDIYEVAFESSIKTISDVRDMFSVDVKGRVAAIRKDGKVDVRLLGQQPSDGGVDLCYKKLVSTRQIKPVSAFTKATDAVMARRIDEQTAEKELRERMAHKLSGLTIEVLSTLNLPDKIKRPGCIVTIVENPQAALSKTAGPTQRQSKAVESRQFVAPFDKKAAKNSTHWFQVVPIHLGDSFCMPPVPANQSEEAARVEREEFTREAERRMAVLTKSTSALIQVVDQEGGAEPSASDRTVGYARIDFAVLQPGTQELTLRLVPTKSMPYSKSTGSVYVRVTCSHTKAATEEKELELASKPSGTQGAAKSVAASDKTAVGDLSGWYQRMVTVGVAPKTSRIAHRQLLRDSLTPTQNAQIDAFHNVLVVIMKRVARILKEIRLLEEFENLPKEETSKFRHVHTVNSNPNSEWLGRLINELSLEVRKDIVVHLEMELLDIAGDDTKREDRKLASGVSREEWIKLRASRQKALQELGGFMMQDRTAAMVLGLPNCFTGQGMVAWIERCPPVLREDKWEDYCKDPKVKASSKLHWSNLALNDEAEAIQSPRGNRGYALQWLSALCGAGYVENVSSLVDVVRDFGKKSTLMEDRADRFYRIREVDMWARGTSRAKSLCPLDLVQELDCHVDDVVETPQTATSTPAPAESSDNKAPLRLRSDFSKKITPHCEGVLGTPSAMSSLFLGSEAHTVLYPVAEKAQEVTSLNVLCDWKYCLFVPATKCMYVYDNPMSTRPDLVIVMTSRACRAAYNFRYDKKGGWFDVFNAALYVKKAKSDEYEPMSAELQEKVLKPQPSGEAAIEFKTADTQLWIQSFSQAGVRIDMLPGQLVILKQLDAAILQHKCIEYETEFEPTDLEASFQRLLNAFFGHHHNRTSEEQDSKNRQTRERIRNELKKTPTIGDSVMAYYGSGKRLSAKPANAADFTPGALHSGHIVRIRSPYSDPKYRFSALYDRNNKEDVPPAMIELLNVYNVTDKAAWLRLPDALRDLFLLYDVKYDHQREAIKEEGLLRDQIRAEGGDLDPAKVRERSTDLNLMYSSTDLEGCITRMVTHFSGKKPLGCLKVPIKKVSPYRVSDTWYNLAPEKEMVQKEDLGQIRIQLRLVQANSIQKSKVFPAMIEEMLAKQPSVLVSPTKTSSKRSVKSQPGAKSRDRTTTSAATTVPVLSREPSFLKISINEAHNLKIADFFSRSSDPYVQIMLLESESDCEVDTLMKTDYKARTLHPRWENQEFTLGKTDLTALSDKKAMLLRVMDHDNESKDDPLGCVQIEFQRDPSGFVTELVLHCANPDGSPTSRLLQLDASRKVKVEAMLVPDLRAGMSKSAFANNKAGEGKLGTLNFEVELVCNENYVKPIVMDALELVLDAKTSAEIVFEKAAVVKTVDEQATQSPAPTDVPETYDWGKFTVAFQPFDDSDERIPYDPNAEDLSSVNAPKLADVLSGAGSYLIHTEAAPNAAVLAASMLKVLGRSYNITDVAHFQVQLESESLNLAFSGKFGHNEAILRHPEKCACFPAKLIVLKDPNIKDWEIHLTVSVHLIAIGRGTRIQRALADTFRIVGLTFDPAAMGKKSAESGSSDLASFLRDVCKCQVTPECTTADVLMEQVQRLRSASKLHWRFTPQLLWFVFEYALCRGQKDRVSFVNGVALDDVLKRWNIVLASIEEAKSQQIGQLHGELTPALIQSLFTHCDWTGFELPSGSDRGDAASIVDLDTRVLVEHTEIKHCSAAVDLRLANGQFIGATVIREYDDDHYDVAFCSGAKVKEEEDVYFSEDEDLPPLLVKETVFLCPIATGNTAEELAAQRGRVGTVATIDKVKHPKEPFLVSFNGAQGLTTQWKPRGCLDSTQVRVHGKDVHLQLMKGDAISVYKLHPPDKSAPVDQSGETASKEDPGRPATIVKCIGNGKYNVEFLDGVLPAIETSVPRARMSLSSSKRVYDGFIVKREREESGSPDAVVPPTVVYDVLLTNGELVRGLRLNQLRFHEEYFPTDRALLGAAFLTNLAVMDSTEDLDASSSVKAMADKLSKLWRNDRAVKVYVVLPGAVDTISVRDIVTNQLVQARLPEVSESKPRFVGQYHGYIKGSNLYKEEVERLQRLHGAKALEREQEQQEEASSSKADELDVDNCVCLLLAPTPRIKVHGCLRLRPNQDSPAVFKRVLAAFLGDRDAFTTQLQRLLRSECGADLPLNRKERVLRTPEVSVSFYGRQVLKPAFNSTTGVCSGEIGEGNRMKAPLEFVSISVRFELLLTPNDRGSMARSMADVNDDATRIVDRLKTLRYVFESPKDHEEATSVLGTSVDMSRWHFESRFTDTEPSGKGPKLPKLEIEFTDHDGKYNTAPIVALELDPLANIRVSARDVAGKTHELSLPIESILAEARLRRRLAPFVSVEAVSGPVVVSPVLFPVDQTLGSAGSSEGMYEVKYHEAKQDKTVLASRSDIITDALLVDVREVSQMTLGKKMGASNMTVEVRLVSSDFDRHADHTQNQKTPLGVTLSPQGEILKNAHGSSCIKSTSLAKAPDSAKYTGSTVVAFDYPSVDLRRVASVRVVLKGSAGSSNTEMGMAEIPMEDIEGFEDPTSPRVVSIVRQDATIGAKRVVGKMHIHLSRVQLLSGNRKVYAKSLASEDDVWTIDAYELLTETLKLREDKVVRGLLTSSMRHEGAISDTVMQTEPDAQEFQLQRLLNVMMIRRALDMTSKSNQSATSPSSVPRAKVDSTNRILSPLVTTANRFKRTLSYTKEVLADTAVELGIRSPSRRLPWGAESSTDAKRRKRGSEAVTVESDLETSTMRLRRTILNLHQLYCSRLVPTLAKLYELDAQHELIDIPRGQQVLRLFQEEVGDLEKEDQRVLNRVRQRVHVAQICRLLSDVMRTTMHVKVFKGSSTVDLPVGVAHIPFIDLLDQLDHDNEYELLLPESQHTTAHSPLSASKQIGALTGLSGYAAASSGVASPTSKVQSNRVRLRIQLLFSEVSLLEEVEKVYKKLKRECITKHENATRRINAAVVPAHRRRWMLLQSNLEQLVAQSKGKLHWAMTPVLLNRVWDVFTIRKAAGGSGEDADKDEYEEGLAQKAEQYRAAVVEVHTRWANLQPKLAELLAIQAAPRIDAQRTCQLLDDIDSSVEGFDIILSTALQQVRSKWESLRAALDQLVAMQERNKLHLGLAPKLLNQIKERCSRGLNPRYAEAVATIQFRLKAITGQDGPLCELRLTDKKGLHWRRTHELLLVLNEQCEGFTVDDARSLEVVQSRWEQVQEWLDRMMDMLETHVVDCTVMPFLLGKMALDDAKPPSTKDKMHLGAGHNSSKASSTHSATVEPPSPRKITKMGSSFGNFSIGKLSKMGSSSANVSESGTPAPLDETFKVVADEAVEDPGRLEGLAEWYAAEEARLELERVPCHRITTDADKNCWLQFSKDGKDTRLLIAEEEMTFTPFNVRAALEDRGVIHKTPVFATGRPDPSSEVAPGYTTGKDNDSRSTVLTKEVLEEIDELERALDNRFTDATESSTSNVPDVLANPERVAELYSVIEDLGKTELLWKVRHAVNTNMELAVPTDFKKLLFELELRGLEGYTDVHNIVKSLTLMLQMKELTRAGVDVSPMATPAAVKELMRQNNVGIVRLPDDLKSIQKLLQDHDLDRKGDPVFMRGMRIGTQARVDGSGSTNVSVSVSASTFASRGIAINTGLGIVDTQIELLRKSLLMEALHKRNSLARTFPVASRVLGSSEEDETDRDTRALEEMDEVDLSGDYMTLVERFQQQLIHEAYTKRLASYAALDRCMRALVGVARDEIVTKESIAIALADLKKPAYRLPVEAFTQDELLEAADASKIRTPTDEVLARCPRGRNAKSMAYYAAVSYAAAVYQEVKSFRERVDPWTQRCTDSLPLTALTSSVANNSSRRMIIPRGGSAKLTLRQSMMNWLLGPEEGSLTTLQRRLTEYQRQRLVWASAAVTLQNRWLQRGHGWCDASAAGVGVKVLLERLLQFESANKMHMVATEALLREVADKCINLRPREKAAKEELELRYASNYRMLDTLVRHAEKCTNERKLHTEETPALLYAIDQACVVPHGLNAHHKEAYHVVTFHWLPHQKRLEELVRMHKEGTFSIHRTPELLSAMEYHTEGLAGSKAVPASSAAGENQQQDADKMDEIRGQRKMPSSRSIPRDGGAAAGMGEAGDVWKPLLPSNRVVQPLSPWEKQTSWKVVTSASPTSAASTSTTSPVKKVQLETKMSASPGGSPRRKSSLGDELKELLLSPSKWLIGTPEAASRIQPDKYFPFALSLEDANRPGQ